jgi:hypothetical protein
MIDQGPVKSWANTSTVSTKSRTCPAPDNNNECGSCRACWDPLVKKILNMVNTNHDTRLFKHPKYYTELRKRNKSDQAISLRAHDGECERAPDPGHKQQASSSKPQASSFKRQAPEVTSHKHQAPSNKRQA